jgi:hypothetical protein
MNLISILQRHRLITGDQADDLARMPVVGVDQLLSQQVVTEDRLQAALSQEFRIPVVDLSGVELDRELIRRFPGSELFRRNLLPLQEDSGVVQVATHDPLNLEALEELAALSGLVLDLVLAPQEQIARRLKEALGVGGGTVGDLMALSSGVSDERPLDEDGALDDDSQAASVVKLVNEILLKAAKRHVTGTRDLPGAHDTVTGLGKVMRVVEVDQSPIGKTSRAHFLRRRWMAPQNSVAGRPVQAPLQRQPLTAVKVRPPFPACAPRSLEELLHACLVVLPPGSGRPQVAQPHPGGAPPMGRANLTAFPSLL